jgi:hypothetical protein
MSLKQRTGYEVNCAEKSRKKVKRNIMNYLILEPYTIVVLEIAGT